MINVYDCHCYFCLNVVLNGMVDVTPNMLICPIATTPSTHHEKYGMRLRAYSLRSAALWCLSACRVSQQRKHVGKVDSYVTSMGCGTSSTCRSVSLWTGRSGRMVGSPLGVTRL